MDPRPDQELVEYIKRRQEAGGNLIEITNELKNAGWDQTDIDKAIGSLGPAVVKEHVSDTSVPLQVPGFGQQELKLEAAGQKMTVPTRFGSLIILLVAVIAGSGVWWYSFSYNEPESVDASEVVLQLRAKRAAVATAPVDLPQNLDYEIKADGVYYRGDLIKSANLQTFKYVGGDYAKDSAHVYRGEYVIDADPATFEYIGGNYTADKTKIYFLGKSIKDVDWETFEYVGDVYAKDKTIVYKEGVSVEGAKPADCTADDLKGCDKGNQ